MLTTEIRQQLEFLEKELVDEFDQYGQLMTVSADTTILREGQYVKVIPLVLKGFIKVYISGEDKELLLYYIQARESCVMSFSAGRENSPSRIYAICEEETTLLALPVEQVNKWVNKYSSFINLLYNQFNLRYLDLIDTIDQLIFKSLDVRLYNHLKELSRLKNKKLIKVRHQQLANELGSAREVISRMLKKLERETKISQHKGGIEVF